MHKLCLFFVILTFFAGNSFGKNLYVSEISKNSITLNSALKVYDVKLVDYDGKTEIVFPVYKGKNKVYKQFYITDRTFKTYLINALQNNATDTAAAISFKINKFNTANVGSVKVFASVIFNNAFEAECKIMGSPRGLWIAWHAVKENGKWQKKFEITDKCLKNEVEKALLTKYKNETNIAG